LTNKSFSSSSIAVEEMKGFEEGGDCMAPGKEQLNIEFPQPDYNFLSQILSSLCLPPHSEARRASFPSGGGPSKEPSRVNWSYGFIQTTPRLIEDYNQQSDNIMSTATSTHTFTEDSFSVKQSNTLFIATKRE
jgi:hypothetical protein